MLKKIRYGCEGMLIKLVIGFFRSLSFDRASAVGGWLGRMFGPYLSVSRVAKNNLNAVMPELTSQQIDRIIVGMWENLGRVVGEFPHMGAVDFDRIATIDGAEHIAEAGKREGSSIFFSGHFANWEMLPKSGFVKGCPLMLVYRQANNPTADQIICTVRDGYQAGMIPKGTLGAKKLIKEIRKGNAIGMLVDQKMNDGIAIPFFGKDAMTAPAMANLALKYNCPLIPAKVVRVKGARFHVTIYPPMQITPSGDQEQDIKAIMTRVNAMMEEWIREHPEQWLWVHKRWPVISKS